MLYHLVKPNSEGYDQNGGDIDARQYSPKQGRTEALPPLEDEAMVCLMIVHHL